MMVWTSLNNWPECALFKGEVGLGSVNLGKVLDQNLVVLNPELVGKASLRGHKRQEKVSAP
jgi:hypothetical protein